MTSSNTSINLSFLSSLKIAVEHDARLSRYTTFKLGGTCPALIKCTQQHALCATVTSLREHNINFILIGFGSNILASDLGINKVVVRYMSGTPVIEYLGNIVRVDAATLLDTLTSQTIAHGLDGLTALSGIPGTLGGAIAGNAGAYGEQISDHLVSVTVLRPDNSIVILPKAALGFSYRDSILKHNGDIILSAEFDLAPCQDKTALKAKHHEVVTTRKFKHAFWQETPCAGSFFRNVEPTSKAERRQSAGWFLEEAGAKALNINGAHAYVHHANIITREDGASAQDVHDLTMKMKAMVKEKFGIELVREVRLIGKFNNAPDCNTEGFW